MGPVMNRTLRRRLAHTLDLPAGIADQATIHLMGDAEARIVNHRGLVQYTSLCIKARSLQGMIELTGEDLEIVSFSSSEMKIAGRIRQVVLK